MTKIKVLFIHGFEGSPKGFKVEYLRNREEFDVRCEAMNTLDWKSCVEVQKNAVLTFKPDVLVGSSFGGALAFHLMETGSWNGPTLLLAPAQAYFPSANQEIYGMLAAHGPVQMDLGKLKNKRKASMPDNVKCTIVHGLKDTVIPIDDSRELTTGASELVKFIELDDDHSLNTALLQDDTLANMVKDLADIK